MGEGTAALQLTPRGGRRGKAKEKRTGIVVIINFCRRNRSRNPRSEEKKAIPVVEEGRDRA